MVGTRAPLSSGLVFRHKLALCASAPFCRLGLVFASPSAMWILRRLKADPSWSSWLLFDAVQLDGAGLRLLGSRHLETGEETDIARHDRSLGVEACIPEVS